VAIILEREINTMIVLKTIINIGLWLSQLKTKINISTKSQVFANVYYSLKIYNKNIGRKIE
jgi:uncharacterized protein YqfA (UPF0365 family)